MARSRYIDAYEAIRRINMCEGDKTIRLIAALDAVAFTPTADVQEVRHGRWIAVTHKCSECEEEAREISVYCPHCGARMDQ